MISFCKCLFQILFFLFLQVKLCGHATLASAHVLFSNKLVDGDTVEFLTLSGILTAKKLSSESDGQFYIELNFPVEHTMKYDNPDEPLLVKAFSDTNVVDVHITKTSKNLLVLRFCHVFSL